MSVHQAVNKLTSDIADFHRIDAGRPAVGRRADLVVLDPERLNDTVEEIHEEPMAGFGDQNRLVRRNDDSVSAVMVNGNVAWRGGTPADDLGTARRYGRFLPLGG